MLHRRSLPQAALHLAWLVALASCNGTTERARPEPSATVAASAQDEAGFCEAAPSATAPSCGSEWCEEHGIAEADCVACKEQGRH